MKRMKLGIAEFSESNKQMALLTADGIESELVELDCSGMRENEIIDLNEEGRRWEGGEWNGKPFGFGCEYSEEGNLVYEGFVFEGKKVCFGKEWNDDENNNCLMYEGGYWNDERFAGRNKLLSRKERRALTLAGGSGKGDGVRIMSIQIFDGPDYSGMLLYM